MKPRIVAAALLATALVGGPGAAQQAAYKVVAHPSSASATLGRDQVSKMFLKKAGAWDDGQAVSPVDLPESSPVRAAFSKDVHGRSTSAVKSYWQQRIFSGRDVPPAELGSDADVLAFVKSRPGAIGYVSVGAPEAGVKVLKVVLKIE